MPKNAIVLKDVSPAVSKRARTVEQAIKQAAKNMKIGFFDLCEYLAEFRGEEFYLPLGFGSFEQWVEEGDHELDMKARQAFYLANIGDKAKKLGITRKQLEAAKPSKLKEIFTLDADTNGKQIKQLVGEAANASLDDIKKKVSKLKADVGQEATTWRNFKVTESQAEVIDDAINELKNQHGDTIDESGDPQDITDSKAIELICADFLSRGVDVEVEPEPPKRKGHSARSR